MAEDTHLEQTEHSLAFLARLDSDRELAAACERTDLEGRLRIGAELGFAVTEPEFRRAIRSWDYGGRWTRWQSFGRISDDTRDLPDLAGEYPVSRDQVEAYWHDGHIHLPQVLSREEMDCYRPVVRAMVANHNTQLEARYETSADRGYLQVVNMHMRSPAARRLTRSPRLAKIAADLLEVPAVRIYIDQAFYKEPGGKVSHWHQDQLYYPLDTDKVITMWLPLVDVSPDMGVVAYASGSHRRGFLGFKPDRDDAEEDLPRFVSQLDHPIWKPDGVAVGDVILHHGWVLHGAYANESDRIREVVTIIYYPDGTPIVSPQSEFQRRAIEYMMDGKKPGEPAAGPLNPVVYPAA